MVVGNGIVIECGITVVQIQSTAIRSGGVRGDSVPVERGSAVPQIQPAAAGVGGVG